MRCRMSDIHTSSCSSDRHMTAPDCENAHGSSATCRANCVTFLRDGTLASRLSHAKADHGFRARRSERLDRPAQLRPSPARAARSAVRKPTVDGDRRGPRQPSGRAAQLRALRPARATRRVRGIRANAGVQRELDPKGPPRAPRDRSRRMGPDRCDRRRAAIPMRRTRDRRHAHAGATGHRRTGGVTDPAGPLRFFVELLRVPE